MDNSSIYLKFDDQTEDLLQSVLKEFNDELIDKMSIVREFPESRGLASEPATIAATITASSLLIISITRLIERWLEKRRQEEARGGLIKASLISNEALQAMKELEMKHADVSITYTLSKEKQPK